MNFILKATKPKSDKSLSVFSPTKSLIATITINGLLLILALIVMLITPSARLSANVNTEFWSIDLKAGDILSKDLILLPLENQEKTRCDAPGTLFAQFEELVPIDMRLVFSSNEKGSTLKIIPKGNKSYAEVVCGDEAVMLRGQNNFFLTSNGDTKRIIQEGKVILGNTPTTGKKEKKILTDGTITASSSSFPFKSGRISQSTKLYAGDKISFSSLKKRQDVIKSTTYSEYDEIMKSYQVIVHTNAHYASVKQIGSDISFPISRAPSFWARLEAQGEWAIFLLVIALISNSFMSINQYSNFKQLIHILGSKS